MSQAAAEIWDEKIWSLIVDVTLSAATQRDTWYRSTDGELLMETIDSMTGLSIGLHNISMNR